MKQYRVVILLNILVSNFKQFITANIKRTLFNKCFNRSKNHIATYKFIIVHDPTLLLFSLRNMGIEHKRHTQLRFATEGAFDGQAFDWFEQSRDLRICTLLADD